MDKGFNPFPHIPDFFYDDLENHFTVIEENKFRAKTQIGEDIINILSKILVTEEMLTPKECTAFWDSYST